MVEFVDGPVHELSRVSLRYTFTLVWAFISYILHLLQLKIENHCTHKQAIEQEQEIETLKALIKDQKEELQALRQELQDSHRVSKKPHPLESSTVLGGGGARGQFAPPENGFPPPSILGSPDFPPPPPPTP